MARKKQEEPKAGSPEWMATFSDLMNLLLCFFVLLYSMSSIDAEKYDAIRASLSNSVSFFSGGKTLMEENSLMEGGVAQIEELTTYDRTDGSNEEKYENYSESLKDSMSEVKDQKEEITSTMYDEITEELENKGVPKNKVDISVDSNYNFIRLTIDGTVLFNSGSAELKKEALPILSKVGDVLKVYDGYLIELEGHTDNIPITSNKAYPDNMWLSTARALNAANYLTGIKGLNPTTLKSSGRGEYDPIQSNSSEEGRQMNRRVEVKIYHELSSY